MKHILFIFFVLLPTWAVAQDDIVIFRDGREKNVKILQVGKEQTLCKVGKSKEAEEQFIENSKIYMLKYKTRGNAYFSDGGELITNGMEPVKIPQNATLIYTLDRRELVGYDVTIQAENVVYAKQKGKKNTQLVSVPKDEVFFVKYADGTKDILNDFEEPKVEQEPVSVSQMNQLDSVAVKPSVRQYPCLATIVTKKKIRMKVYVYGEDETTISYRKVKSTKASLFKIARTNIQTIKF